MKSESLGEGATDQEIIEWCGRNDRVWITADLRARTEHAAEILAEGIRVIWIHRPPNHLMGRAATLRVLAYQLPRVVDHFSRDPSQRYYRVEFMGDPLLDNYRLKLTSVAEP